MQKRSTCRSALRWAFVALIWAAAVASIALGPAQTTRPASAKARLVVACR